MVSHFWAKVSSKSFPASLSRTKACPYPAWFYKSSCNLFSGRPLRQFPLFCQKCRDKERQEERERDLPVQTTRQIQNLIWGICPCVVWEVEVIRISIYYFGRSATSVRDQLTMKCYLSYLHVRPPWSVRRASFLGLDSETYKMFKGFWRCCCSNPAVKLYESLKESGSCTHHVPSEYK